MTETSITVSRALARIAPSQTTAMTDRATALQQRFIFLTGDTVSRETLAFFEQTGVRWLTKPFRAADVRRIIQQVLPAG